MDIKEISGGVCAAKGFKAAGIHCGIRKNKNKKDLALIVSDTRAASAAVYTKNLVKGAPLIVTERNLADGFASAVVCNSGNANTCNADGEYIAAKMCELVAHSTGIAADDVIIASTGVIGQPLDVAPIESAMPQLAARLDTSASGSLSAAQAIMTTDTFAKEIAVEFELGGVRCVIGGMAKGSGMIHPDMATMLVFITTDADIASDVLSKALVRDVKDSFNMLSVDGDTSTNDMVSIMANGMAENKKIEGPGPDYDKFCAAVAHVTNALCRMIAKDGEGATKLLECTVSGAESRDTARIAAKAVICSSLVKTAMYGADANWGRVLCAIGYCGTPVNVKKIDVEFRSAAGAITVCKDGAGVVFSEQKAKEILLCDEITIAVNLNSGTESATAWGCDLTHGYIDINSDYRT